LIVLQHKKEYLLNQAIYPEANSEKKSQDVEELDGDLDSSSSKDKIMHSIIPVQKDVENGNLINEALSKGLSSFNPDMMYQNLVNNFRTAKELYGETIIRQMTGYGNEDLERNMNIPEFQREVKESIKRNTKELIKEKILNNNGTICRDSFHLVKLSMLLELDNFCSKSNFGKEIIDQKDIHGENDETINYKKGMPYKDISVKASTKVALRRKHEKLDISDLRTITKKSKNKNSIIYALDASGSMKGQKIKMSKQAGVSLAYFALDNHDEVGMVIFSKDISKNQNLTSDFNLIINNLIDVVAKGKTDIVKALEKCLDLLDNSSNNKHVVLITDGLANVGDDPTKEVLSSVMKLKSQKITVSVIGIDVDKEGEKLGRKITELSGGNLYIAKPTDDLSSIVLQDYNSFKR